VRWLWRGARGQRLEHAGEPDGQRALKAEALHHDGERDEPEQERGHAGDGAGEDRTGKALALASRLPGISAARPAHRDPPTRSGVPPGRTVEGSTATTAVSGHDATSSPRAVSR
jgi:hypothetical protein